MKKTVTLVIVALSVVAIALALNASRQREEKTVLQDKDGRRRKVVALANSYDAGLEWMQVFDVGDFYTIQLQDALLHPKEHHHLLLAAIVDVLRKDSSNFFTAHESTSDIYFQLGCSSEHVKYIRTEATADSGMFQQWAIVMSATSVHKPVLQLFAENDDEMAMISHDASDIVLVKGKCIDLISLGDSEFSAHEFPELTGEQNK